MAPAKKKCSVLKKYREEKNLLNTSAVNVRARGRGRPPKTRIVEIHHLQSSSMEYLKKVEPLVLEGNVAEKWRIFKRDFGIFSTAIELSKKSENVKVAIFLNAIGSEAVDVFYSFGLSDEDAAKYDTVVKAFDEFCEPKSNEVYETYKFYSRNQQMNEPFDNFLIDLKKLVRKCGFDDDDRMLRDRIVMGTRDEKLQKRLLEVEKLTLGKAIDMARAAEIVSQQAKDMQKQNLADPTCSTSLDAVIQQQKDKYKYAQKKAITNNNNNVEMNYRSERQKPNFFVSRNYNTNNAYNKYHTHVNKNNVEFTGKLIRNCNFCKLEHNYGKCPAFGRTCNNCGRTNHFAVACMTKKVSEIKIQPQEDDSLYIDAITGNLCDQLLKLKQKKCWMHKIRVENYFINFKLDTGAECNVLPESYLKYFKEFKIEKFDKSLQAYGGNELKVIGKLLLICSVKNEISNQEFLIVKSESVPIFGLKGCIDLNLIQRIDSLSSNISNNDTQKTIFLKENSDLFEGLGCFVENVNIVLKEGSAGSVKPARRIPLSLMSSVKNELNVMIKKGVICKNDEPADFVSNLVVVEKKNGKLRLCIDPKELNKAIMKENFPIPTFDEIAEKLNGKKIFSVLDLKEGYWQVKLSENASRLCTFSTPFGCYRFLRMPFGISIAPEIFQKNNERNFEGISGVIIYFDDVMIAAETLEEHDEILKQVMERARSLNIKFNKEKLQYRLRKVNYLGQMVSANGISCDPDRVKAIQKIEKPQDKKDLKKLLGVINFMREYIPNLSELCRPLYTLLKKGVYFQWMKIHDEALNLVKELICNAPTLKVFDVNKEVSIETDASKYGLGCCLMQDGKPIYFASRSLSDTEVRYSQIEKEFLAVVFACNKFHYYIYGRRVIVKTDHKPLVSIMQKDISAIPSPRLQRMKLRLSKYTIELKYVPGKYLYIADLLSRYFDKDNRSKEIEDMDELVHSLNCSDKKKAQFQSYTDEDRTLKKLKETIINGWPKNKNSLDEDLKPYYRMREDLIVEDGIVFLNERIIVPHTMRHEVLQQLHSSHLGIEKTKSRARSIIYWPQINQDIENVIVRCQKCQRYRSANTKEPMLPHIVPNLPYQKIGMDIMHFEGKDYLVVNDYYSRFLDISPLRNKTASEVCTKLKNSFSIHGLPTEIIADNMPFGSFYFRKFCSLNDIQLTTTSPMFAQSNGFSEKSVQIAKNMLKKCRDSDTELWQALLEYRNTPVKEVNASPVELLMSRKTRTLIPAYQNLFSPKVIPNISNNIKVNRQRQKHYYDQNSRYKSNFQKGDLIYYKDIKKGWIEATIKDLNSSPRSYWIELNNGVILRRNSNVLRARNA